MSIGSVEAQHLLVLVDIELVMIGNAPVVFERFGATGLFVERGHRNIADFEQLGRGEKDQVDRIVIDRVDDAAFIEQHRRAARVSAIQCRRLVRSVLLPRWQRQIVPIDLRLVATAKRYSTLS